MLPAAHAKRGRGYPRQRFFNMENQVNSFVALYKAYQKTRCGKRDNPTAMRYRMEAIERTADLSDRLRGGTIPSAPTTHSRCTSPRSASSSPSTSRGRSCSTPSVTTSSSPASPGASSGTTTRGRSAKARTTASTVWLTPCATISSAARRQTKQPAELPACHTGRWRNGTTRTAGCSREIFSKFFYTLVHAICFEKAKKALAFLSDPELRDFVEWLLWLIIDSTPDPGIPIGNQSSQLLALLYLDDFDHWLRDDLGLVYGRYMDDFYIISSDKLLLRRILKEIEDYIKPLGLRLNNKTQIFPLKNGIDFLGFHTYLTSTGKVVRKVRAKSIDNMKRKIRKYRGLVDSGRMTLESVLQSYASWCGHISHGNTYHLRQNMDAYFFGYFPELRPTPKGENTHGPKTEQPRKQVEGEVRHHSRQADHLARG